MRDLDIKTLRLLVAVCEHGNMRDAALQENIEPSAISKRIAQLEDEVGTQILIRGRRGAEPTAAGQALLEHARNILFTMGRIESEMELFKGGVRGHVRVAASASAIAESLLDDLAEFMAIPEHQDIKVDIEERFSKDIISMVRDGVVSIGVCWKNNELDDLEHKPYRQDELTLAVSPKHRLAKLNRVRFEDTLDEEHIGLHPSTAVYSMLQRAASKAGKRMRYRVVVSNFDAAFRVVGAGLGISVVPRQVSEMYVSAGNVRLVQLENEWAKREFSIIHKPLGVLTPAALKLMEFLANKSFQ